MKIVKTILQQMFNMTKPQRKFMQVVFPLLISLRGWANFRNLSRYSDYHEKTFSRWYRHHFDLVEFNRLSLLPLSQAENSRILRLIVVSCPKAINTLRYLAIFTMAGVVKPKKVRFENLHTGRGKPHKKYGL